MSSDNSALEEQLERIQTEINEADPERVKYIATELVSVFKQLSSGSYMSSGVLMIPHYLSDITEEPEKCQYTSWDMRCENWALVGEHFCDLHIN